MSKLLVSVAQPVYKGASFLAEEIPRKVKSNAPSIRLSNGRVLRFAKDAGIGIASAIHWHGLDGYEPPTSRTLQFFFERVECLVDVGANCGLYSLVAALLNPKLRVLAFEPEPGIFRNLQANIHLNNLTSQISAYQMALSDQDGKIEFYLPPSSSLDTESTGTIVGDSWQHRKQHSTLYVDAIRFDEFPPARDQRIELVKIDVEDAEAKVLCGMADTIRRDRPLIVCEILQREHRNERTLRVIQELGYTPYWITPDAYIRVSDFSFERATSQDFLLSPRRLSSEIVSNPAAFVL